MEHVAIEVKPEVDEKLAQAHRLKALESKDAEYHMKNSLIDALMRPQVLNATQDLVKFNHYKYTEIIYSKPWAEVIKILVEARGRDNWASAKSRFNEMLSTKLKKQDLRFSETEKYVLQLISFNNFCDNQDYLQSNEIISIADREQFAQNRIAYIKALYDQNYKAVEDCKKGEIGVANQLPLHESLNLQKFVLLLKTGEALAIAELDKRMQADMDEYKRWIPALPCIIQ